MNVFVGNIRNKIEDIIKNVVDFLKIIKEYYD